MKRRGFTIIELLIVITIIAILMSMVMKAVGVAISHAKHAATVTTIKKTNTLINSRMEAAHRLLLRPGWLQGSPYWNRACELTTDPNLRNILAKKLTIQALLPQRREELFSTNQAVDAQLDILYRGLRSEPQISNEEIIYAVLTNSDALSDVVGADAFTSAEIGTGPNGLPTFKDAWGQSLQFYRWPTRLMTDANAYVLLESRPIPIERDPDDPLRRCMSYPTFLDEFHDPAVFHIPIIMSAGPDTYFGLGNPNASNDDRLFQIIDIELATDNILQVRPR